MKLLFQKTFIHCTMVLPFILYWLAFIFKLLSSTKVIGICTKLAIQALVINWHLYEVFQENMLSKRLN